MLTSTLRPAPTTVIAAVQRHAHQRLRLPLDAGATLVVEGRCLLLPRTAAAAHVHGFAPFVAEPCAALLLNRGDRVDLRGLADAQFSADLISLPGDDGAAGDAAFPMPWTRVLPEQYIGLRIALLQAAGGEARQRALADWAHWLVGSANAVWRQHVIPGERTASQARERQRFALVQSICEHINGHWSRNVSLDELAERFELSSFHLVRAFRQVMGATPHQYLIHLRLRRSLDLIAEERYRIVEIADATGFCSHAHFSNAFRNVFGTTPREFGALLGAEPRSDGRDPASRRLRAAAGCVAPRNIGFHPLHAGPR